MIEYLVLFGVALVVVSAMARSQTSAKPVTANAWMHVAVSAGVADVSADSETSFGGTDGALRVRVELFRDQDSVMASVVISGLAPEITIERADDDAVTWRRRGRDFQVGASAFDAAFFVASSEDRVVRALLDEETRTAAYALFGSRYPVTVVRGELRATLRAHAPVGAFDGPTLRALLDLAHRFEPFDEIETPLARIVKADPHAGVRAGALQALLESSPKHGRTLEALRAAVKDAEPSIRLRAAIAQGDEGLPVLQALALDSRTDDALAAEAVTALAAEFPVEAAVQALARGSRGERPRTGEAAAGSLAASGGSDAERALVAALAGDWMSVAAAAARELGRCGGVAVVPDLRRAERRGGDVDRAAREAIAAIQSRLTGATPGQVSLVGGESGQLSVAETADGRVSLKDGAD